ncbi:MAG: hypothetical protein AB7F89_12365 [Pirellulaceae bacterium]
MMTPRILIMLLVTVMPLPVSAEHRGGGNASGGRNCCPHHACSEHACQLTCQAKEIKKTVYEVKCVPVCEHRPAHFLASCDCCPVCQLKYRKVLIKREVFVGHSCAPECRPVPATCGPCQVSVEP